MWGMKKINNLGVKVCVKLYDTRWKCNSKENQEPVWTGPGIVLNLGRDLKTVTLKCQGSVILFLKPKYSDLSSRHCQWWLSVASFKLCYPGLKKLISLKERKPCWVSMEKRFSPSLLCVMWSFPHKMQQSSSDNENKYLKHLTQVVCDLCSWTSIYHLKKSHIEFIRIEIF